MLRDYSLYFNISHVMINWIPFMIDILITLTQLEVGCQYLKNQMHTQCIEIYTKIAEAFGIL